MRKVAVILTLLVSYVALLAAIVAAFDPANLFSDNDVPVGGIRTLCVLCAIPPAVAYLRGPVRRRRRFVKGRCVYCGYDLRGTPTDTCSECGRPRAVRAPLVPKSVFLRYLMPAGVLLIVPLCLVWEYIPGTLIENRNGFFFGSGVNRYYYRAGPLKLVERIRAGIPVEHTWFHPNGAVIAHEVTPGGTGNGYSFREDGTIRVKKEYVNCLAHGTARYYNRDGSVNRTVRFADGVPVEGKPPPYDGP